MSPSTKSGFNGTETKCQEKETFGAGCRLPGVLVHPSRHSPEMMIHLLNNIINTACCERNTSES